MENLWTSDNEMINQAIVKILSNHVGCSNAISRADLLDKCSQYLGTKIHERKMRKCIQSLRENGYLICSLPGSNGGYYLPSNYDEFQRFVNHEYNAKIASMHRTLSLMKKAAVKNFNMNYEQLPLWNA